MADSHIPVLINEFLELINCKEGGIYVDATIGNAGHSLQLLKKYPEAGSLVGIDCDMEAVERSRQNLESFSDKAIVLYGNFGELKNILGRAGIYKIDGILFDLGFSTSQLKDPRRGLSFMLQGPLDMRMDKNTSLQAKDLINQVSALKLEKILREYGEESWAKRISINILKRRQQKPIENTSELSDIVLQSIPARYYPKKIHPATKTFQALRIAVNDELNSIEKGLDDAIDMLNPGGRLCVISFHSLEDRIVKNRFRDWSKSCKCPSGIPLCVCNGKKRFKIITRKPVTPSKQEVTNNPQSRSAKLRAGERI
jgi:16S rRNA (cytosine1402-N4)-methyltransferase